MGSVRTAEVVKRVVPKFLRRPLGNLRAVFRRLSVWLKVARYLKGVNRADSAVLLRALLRSPITVWRNLDRWQYPAVSDDCAVISKGVGSFQVRAKTDDLLHVLPKQEPAVEAIIRDHLKPGDTFIDAGANIGFYTILGAMLVGPTGHVIACEMIPATLGTLREHVRLNDCQNVTVSDGALAPISGKVVKASVTGLRSGTASISRCSDGDTVRVRTITLAEIVGGFKSVKLMKMDLEGAELGALEGLGRDLEKIEAIVFENKNDPETVEFLRLRGFSINRIDGSNAVAEREG